MLIIIPARGGSKTVRRKNLQPVAGKPLFLHVAETARQAFPDARIIVSTDDPEIASVALIHSFEVHQRSNWAATDDATIIDVVAEVQADTLNQDGVLLIQPTVPQLTAYQLEEFVETNSARPHIGGVPHPHIIWQRFDSGPLSPRTNRQTRLGWPLQEIGVYWWPAGRIGGPPELVHQFHDLIDIDTWTDLQQVRQEMEPATVVFRYRANEEVGMGHIRRCLALASELQTCKIVFQQVGRVYLRALDMTWSDWPEGVEIPGRVLVVNDILDTGFDDVLPYKQKGWPVVNLEDHGTGGRYADLVVNALYHPRGELGSYVYGPSWAVLRPEFLSLPPFEVRSEGVPRVLGLFGGTDPAGLTPRLKGLCTTVVEPGDDVSVAAQMMQHDLLITSAGRTVYEAAAVGIPTIVLAQNLRETTHSHLGGTAYLGLGVLTPVQKVVETINGLWETPVLRQEMSDRGRRLVDGKGARRIAHRIQGLLEGL